MSTARPKPPVVTILVPGGVPPGSAAFTLNVFGTDFMAPDVILWDGDPQTTTFVSAFKLTAVIPATLVTAVASVPVNVRTDEGDLSNVVPFAVSDDPPPIPSVPLLEGFTLLMDAFAKPFLLRPEEVIAIEEAIEAGDATGPLYGKNPATAYRRLTLRGGAQIFVSRGSLSPLLEVLTQRR